MDYAVIMAGGAGKRLWPLSRQDRPKQVLRLVDGKSLLRSCLERIEPVITQERVLVLTNRQYLKIVKEELPGLDDNQVIAEPQMRDTCGAIGLAAAILHRSDPDATMAVITADQAIRPELTFQQVLQDGLRFVNSRPASLLTFGVRPRFPSTQLGYIKLSKAQSVSGCSNNVYLVDAFKEKPDLETATRYLAEGTYLWNSGMFVWKARRILELIARFVPEAAGPLEAIGRAWGGPSAAAVLEEQFPRLPKISIDYAVMEKASDIYAIELDCQWLDLGSYQALAELMGRDESGNTLAADAGLLDCHDTIVVSEDKGHLIAGIGLEEMIIVHSPSATLVCPVGQADRLKELLEYLAAKGKGRYL